MKILLLLALTAVYAVGITEAAPYTSLDALAEKEDVDQTAALLRMLLSSMMMDSNQVAAEQENALAQDNFLAKMAGYLQQGLNQREEIAKEELCSCHHGHCSCHLGHLRCRHGHHHGHSSPPTPVTPTPVTPHRPVSLAAF